MGRVDVIPVSLENVFGLVLLTLLLSLGSCTGSSLLPIEDLLVLYLCYGLPFHVSFHRKYLLCLPPFLNFAVNNRQQAELVSLAFSTLVTIFSNSGWRFTSHQDVWVLWAQLLLPEKKKLFRFFFSHTHIFQLEVGFVSHRGLSVLSEVVCTSGVSPDPVLIAFSIKEITSRLTSFRNNALGCVLSGTKQSPHIGKLQIQA